MHTDIGRLSEVQVLILLELRNHGSRNVTQLTRSMGLGGTTFQAHIRGLVSMKMVIRKIKQLSKIRTVEYELTTRGRNVADLLDRVSLLVSDTIDSAVNPLSSH